MSGLVMLHYRRELEDLGYPTGDIRYSLGHCQGDGMAFYGRVGDPAGLAGRLLNGEEKEAAVSAVEMVDGCLEIHPNQFGARYSHHRTMRVDLVSSSTHLFDDLTQQESSALDSLVAAVKEDVALTSQRLEEAGYAIADATPTEPQVVRKFRTCRFTLTVTELPDQDFGLEHWDGDSARSFLRELVEGRARYFGVEVTISGAGLTLGSASLWGVTDGTESPDKRYGGNLRDLVSEAVAGARERLAMLCPTATGSLGPNRERREKQ